MQIGNKEGCASDSESGTIASKILDEYMKEFQQRNPTLKVFSAHLHLDEATPHLHIDFVLYITGSKCGVDIRVSLKQALGALVLQRTNCFFAMSEICTVISFYMITHDHSHIRYRKYNNTL